MENATQAPVLTLCICLCGCYAMSGTDRAHRTTSPALDTRVRPRDVCAEINCFSSTSPYILYEECAEPPVLCAREVVCYFDSDFGGCCLSVEGLLGNFERDTEIFVGGGRSEGGFCVEGACVCTRCAQ
eukprot:478660-Rhodomonas_salina.1